MRPANPWWYFLALCITLGSVVVAFFIAHDVWGSIEDAVVTEQMHGIDASGQSLAVFVVNPADDIECIVTDQNGNQHDVRPVLVNDQLPPIVIQSGGREWEYFGLHAEGRQGQSVECTPADGIYGTAVVAGFDKVNIAAGIVAIGTLVGLGLAIWTYFVRRDLRRNPA